MITHQDADKQGNLSTSVFKVELPREPSPATKKHLHEHVQQFESRLPLVRAHKENIPLPESDPEPGTLV